MKLTIFIVYTIIMTNEAANFFVFCIIFIALGDNRQLNGLLSGHCVC